MATIAYSEEMSGELGSDLPIGTRIITWAAMAQGDVGATYEASAHYPDKCVQFTGTFGGATIVLQGSLGTASPTYFTLTDPQGNAISKTDVAGEQVLENCYTVRPNITGGDGTTAITVKLLMTTIARR